MKTEVGRHQGVVLGIVGGAGPLVAARLQWEFLSAHQKETGACKDADYPPTLCRNVALPGVDETGVRNAKEAKSALQDALETLAVAGATHALIACASLHACIPLNPPIPVVNWMEWGARKLYEQGVRSVGVVGSSSARRDGVFRHALLAHDLDVVELSLDEQPLSDRLIAKGMTGRFSAEDRGLVSELRKALVSRGAQRIWWGCTELSLMPRTWLGSGGESSMNAMVSALLRVSSPSPQVQSPSSKDCP